MFKISGDLTASTSLGTLSNRVSTLGVLAGQGTPFQSSPVPAAVNGTLTVPAPQGEISFVSIAGSQPYVLGSGRPGEFVLSGGNLVLTLRQGDSPPVGTLLQFIGVPSATDIPTNRVSDVPDLYRMWNISGQVSINLEFQGHPSASLQFTTLTSNRAAVEAAFARKSIYWIGKLKFEVRELNIEELSRRVYPNSYIQVSVSLSGCWEYLSEQQIRLAPEIVPQDYQWFSTSSFALRSGIPYQGYDPQIRTEGRDQSLTSLSDVLSPVRMAMGGSFVSWENPYQVESKVFGQTRVWLLTDEQVILPPNLSYRGTHDSSVGQLGTVYRNTRINLDYVDAQSEEANEKDAQRLQRTIHRVPLDSPGNVPQESRGFNFDLRDVSKAFDSGGPTKTQTTTHLLGKNVLFEKRVSYGWVFCGIDVYQLEKYTVSGTTIWTTSYNSGFTGIACGVWWKQIEDVETIYDYRDGYLVRISTRGWKLARVRQESSNYETLSLLINLDVLRDNQSQVNYLNLKIAEYRDFKRTKFSEEIKYDLDYFSGYYSLKGLGFEPKFVKRKVHTKDSVVLSSNPDTTDSNPKPPLITGISFIEEEDITIPIPQRVGKEFYITQKQTSSREGVYLAQTLKISEREMFYGRPPEAEKLDSVESDRPKKIGVSPNLLANTAGNRYGKDNPEQGTVSFPTQNEQEAKLGAVTLTAIDNSRDSISGTMKIRRNLEIRSGDIVQFQGKQFVVFSANTIDQIMGEGLVTSEGTELSIGVLVFPTVEFS